MKEEHECVNRRRVKDVPGRAAAHLFRNLLNRYLLKPYYVPSTAAGGGGSEHKGKQQPRSPCPPPPSDLCHPEPLHIFGQCGCLLRMEPYGTVGMPFLEPREQGPGWFCAEEDVRVCVSQCFDQRHTAVM